MTGRRKILVVMDLSAIESGIRSIGGVDTVCQCHLQGLLQRSDSRFDYVVLGFNRANDLGTGDVIRQLAPNVRLYWYNYHRRRGSARALPNVAANEQLVRHLVRDIRPDIVHSHNPAWHIVKYGSEKKVLTLHTYKKIARTPVGPLNDFLHENLIQPISIASSDLVSTVSSEICDVLDKRSATPAVYIPNAVDPIYFRNERGLNDDSGPNILLMGNIEARKRTADALKVIKSLRSEHKDIKLVLAGRYGQDTSYLAELQAYIQNNDMKECVELLGLVDKRTQLRLMREASVGLFLSENETFGLAPLEMMAAGVPTVTTACGIFDLRRDDFVSRGVDVVETGDTDSIVQILDSRIRTKRFQVSPKLKSFIRSSFSVETYINRNEELYDRVITTCRGLSNNRNVVGDDVTQPRST